MILINSVNTCDTTLMYLQQLPGLSKYIYIHSSLNGVSQVRVCGNLCYHKLSVVCSLIISYVATSLVLVVASESYKLL